MEKQELETLKIDSEDMGEILINLQNSFKFQFLENEIENKMTIGQLADKVISKLNLQEGMECTSQVVFYKLKSHLIKKLEINNKVLSPKTKFREIFPQKGRKKLWKSVFSDFYLKIPDLTPPVSLILTLVLLIAISAIITLSYSKLYGIILFAVSCIGFILSFRFGKTFPVEDLAELVKKLSSENYLDSRRDLNTINTLEIRRLVFEMIVSWQSDEDKKLITMNTKLDYLD